MKMFSENDFQISDKDLSLIIMAEKSGKKSLKLSVKDDSGSRLMRIGFVAYGGSLDYGTVKWCVTKKALDYVKTLPVSKIIEILKMGKAPEKFYKSVGEGKLSRKVARTLALEEKLGDRIFKRKPKVTVKQRLDQKISRIMEKTREGSEDLATKVEVIGSHHADVLIGMLNENGVRKANVLSAGMAELTDRGYVRILRSYARFNVWILTDKGFERARTEVSVREELEKLRIEERMKKHRPPRWKDKLPGSRAKRRERRLGVIPNLPKPFG